MSHYVLLLIQVGKSGVTIYEPQSIRPTGASGSGAIVHHIKQGVGYPLLPRPVDGCVGGVSIPLEKTNTQYSIISECPH